MTLLLIDSNRPSQLTARDNRRWVRLLVRLCTSTLDRQLAEGRSPEANRFLAARAQELVAPVTRCSLAEHWTHLWTVARTPPALGGRRVPLNREAVISCEAEVHQMVRSLRDPLSSPARGTAMASSLLRDGTGPLYNRRRSIELGMTLREINAQLHPAFSL